MMTATRIASVTEATTLERVIRDATKSYTFDCEKKWGILLFFSSGDECEKWKTKVYPHLSRRVAFRWLV